MLKNIWSHKKLLFLAVLVIGVGAWYFFGRNHAPAYTEYKVESKNLVDSIELSGKVNAKTYANLRFPAGGLITYLGAQKGDTVKKYQTLASVDTRQLKKVLEQKLNLYATALTTFDDTKATHQDALDANDIDLTLKRILERNQYSLENAVKDVEYQDLSIKLAHLTSPIAGVLVANPFTVSGVNALATDVWTVVDPTSLEFIADLDEADLKRVSVGQKVIISIDAYPDLKIESTIKSIAFAPKETTSGTTYEVKMALPENVISDLRLGLNGTGEIILQEKLAAPAIPVQAVTYRGGKVEVLVNEGGKYVTKEIEVGTETSSDLEIKQGLSLGDVVYVKK